MTQKHQDSHHEASWWTVIFGLSLGLIGVGVIFISGGDFMIGMGFIFLFFLILALGLFAETSPKLFEKRNNEKMRRGEEVKIGFAKHTWMWIFLASEVLFFTVVIGSSLALRYRVGGWTPSDNLNVTLTAVNTFILICSSYTMAKSLQAIEQGNTRTIKDLAVYKYLESVVPNRVKTLKLFPVFLFATVAIGTLFLLIQLSEYYTLIHVDNFEPNNPSVSYFASTFFIQTGFHGLHVFFGVFIMFFVALKAARGGYSKQNHDSVELIGLYWHFVDLVWIVLFTVVYLL